LILGLKNSSLLMKNFKGIIAPLEPALLVR
jgi:hypothetical protein